MTLNNGWTCSFQGNCACKNCETEITKNEPKFIKAGFKYCWPCSKLSGWSEEGYDLSLDSIDSILETLSYNYREESEKKISKYLHFVDNYL